MNLKTNRSGSISPQVIKRLKEGDMRAYKQIYESFSESLFHFTFYYLKNTAESEEIVQEVFLRIWEIKEEIDESKSFKSYLYKMTINKVYNHLKHQVVEQKYENYLLHYNHSFSETPETSMDYKELDEKICSLLEKLPDQQRNIFNLSRIEGMPNPKISEKLGLSIRTVENQIYRATKFLKQHLKDEYHLALFFIIWLFN